MISEFLPGDTFKYTWINSGTTVSSLSYVVMNGSESIVNTGTLTNSGDGHYFEDYTVPNTEGYYTFKSEAFVNSKPYLRTKRFRVIELEVD